MAAQFSESPPNRKNQAQFEIREDSPDASGGGISVTTPIYLNRNSNTARGGLVPLTTSSLSNQAPLKSRSSNTLKKLEAPPPPTEASHETGLAPLGDRDEHHTETGSKIELSRMQPRLAKHASRANIERSEVNTLQVSAFAELARVKRQLEVANSTIAAMDQELSQQRVLQQTMDQVVGSSAEDHSDIDNLTSLFPTQLQVDKFNPTRADVADFDRSTVLSPFHFDGQYPTGAWNDSFSGRYHNSLPSSDLGETIAHEDKFREENQTDWDAPRLPDHQKFSSTRNNTFESQQRLQMSMDNIRDTSNEANSTGSRSQFGVGQYHGNWPNAQSATSSSPQFSPPITPLPFGSINHVASGTAPYHPRPIGTPLSPTALEFRAIELSNPWSSQSQGSGSTYMPPMEPMNYRRLLDRNMSCNWKYIVDKIVCANDQQASIFLQQKLKVATPEQKYEMVEAIISEAYPLMVNRFGNFLIQRCIEHGTPDQVIAIANAIRGNTLQLSMDPFGCHVVQKAFDVVPEEYKAVMVHELLRRIPETVIHRYACHVWQKLFELRWTGSPPQIMKYVNEALRGMWHEVALGETGSLVVQNIFENCLEDDKRPCINEVISSIDVVAHGQFGNWCIQHICEHGAPADKSRAIEHVLRFATEYSTDQFASKVVEKCLKVCGPDFIDRYLARICEGRSDRPRMPLIDISGDQYGNYLVQHILLHAPPQYRDIVSNHVRKHMVSLRGSKFGSRVAMLCSNPAYATRPGPPMRLPANSRFGNNIPIGRPGMMQYR